jgi:hypothetical protein
MPTWKPSLEEVVKVLIKDDKEGLRSPLKTNYYWKVIRIQQWVEKDLEMLFNEQREIIVKDKKTGTTKKLIEYV